MVLFQTELFHKIAFYNSGPLDRLVLYQNPRRRRHPIAPGNPQNFGQNPKALKHLIHQNRLWIRTMKNRASKYGTIRRWCLVSNGSKFKVLGIMPTHPKSSQSIKSFRSNILKKRVVSPKCSWVRSGY